MLQAMNERFTGRNQQANPSKMRHGEANAVLDDGRADDPVLAPIPMAVPQLPAVLSDRPEVISELRSSLLGFIHKDKTVSVSSVKTSKIATHGKFM